MARPIVVRNQSLADVYRELGLRAERSLIPGHHRVFDAAGLLNVVNEESAWELLERLNLIVREEEKS